MRGNVRPPSRTQGSQRSDAGSAKIALGEWVKNQRRARKKRSTTLLADKEVRLEEICFVWCVCKTWEEMFALLVEHKVVNGHALVPQKNSPRGRLDLENG